MKKNDDEFLDFLESERYINPVYIKGKGWCALLPFIYTIGLVVGITKIGYSHRYCYLKEDSMYAVAALVIWETLAEHDEELSEDPNDEHWIKRKGSVEYTNPNKNI